MRATFLRRNYVQLGVPCEGNIITNSPGIEELQIFHSKNISREGKRYTYLYIYIYIYWSRLYYIFLFLILILIFFFFISYSEILIDGRSFITRSHVLFWSSWERLIENKQNAKYGFLCIQVGKGRGETKKYGGATFLASSKCLDYALWASSFPFLSFSFLFLLLKFHWGVGRSVMFVYMGTFI